MSDRIMGAWVACLLLAGCVQTTTTTNAVSPDADDGIAAQDLLQLGGEYYRKGSYDLARDRLLLSIDYDPDNAIAHYTLALTYEALGNLRLATESYERSVRVAPRDHQVQNAYAVFLCKQGDFDGASKHFNRAAGITENDYAEITLTNAGVCMMQKPDHAEAENYFRKALERKANYGEALIQMALLKHATGEHLNARAFVQRFLGSNPPSSGVLYLGMQIEDELGDESARTDFSNQILRDFPNSREARRILESG